MSDEYRSQFISSLILSPDDLYVEEFENFTATIEGSNLPIFKDMNCPWKLRFSIDENNKLAWSAIEYDVDENGMEILSGTVRVTTSGTPRDTMGLDMSDPDAHEFIETMFPGRPKVLQHYPDSNMFLVDDTFYNFDTMLTKDKQCIQFTLLNGK